MQDRGFYTVEQAADTLNLTPGRIRQMLRASDLEGIPLEESGARGWRIPADVVEERRQYKGPRRREVA
jgi:excisionase family DNA binding protein